MVASSFFMRDMEVSMTDKRNMFEFLLDHIQINDTDVRALFSDAEVERLDIHAQNGLWKFHISNPKRVHPDIIRIFLGHLRKAFAQIADTEVWWSFSCSDNTESFLPEYISFIFMEVTRTHPFMNHALSNAKIAIHDQRVEVGIANQDALELLIGKFQTNIQEALDQYQLGHLMCDYYLDESLQQEEYEQYQMRQEEVEALIQEEAKVVQEIHEQKKEDLSIRDDDVDPIGKEIPNGPTVSLSDLPDHQYKSVIEGYVFSQSFRELRSGGTQLTFNMTDYTSSVQVKLFTGKRISLAQLESIKKGDWLKLEGDLVPDKYTGEMYFRPRSIRHITKAKRRDTAPTGQKRVELHAHTQMSTLDATNSAEDIIKQAADWGHSAVAITDHANVQAFPEAFHAAQNHNIKVIYGMEAYVVNDGELVAYNPQDILLKTATFVVFDLETTGLSSVYDSIIEVGAVKMKEGAVIDRFEAFINPGHPLSSFTTELTGITDDMVKDAPEEAKVLQDFWKFSQGSILVAHNASFDVGFINGVYKRLGLGETDLPVIDTLELSRIVNPQFKSHRLNTLAKRYNIELENHHRAIYDSETTAYLCVKLLEQAEKQFQMIRHKDLNNDIGKNDAYKQARPFHATILVKEQEGLKDLFKLVSESNIHYFHRQPRVPRSLLRKYRKHFLIGTACSEGEIFTTMMQKGYDEAEKLIDFYDYIEILPPSAYLPLIQDGLIRHMDDLIAIIKELIRLGEAHHIPVVATGNVHYLDEKDAIYREVIFSSFKANANRKLNMPSVHFRTTQEMLSEFDFLDEEKAYEIVVKNPQTIAESIDDVQVIQKELFPPKIEGAEDDIRKMSYERAKSMYGDPLPDIVEKRLEKELSSIIGNGFAVIYLISQKLVHKSNEDGYLVGSRGSVGSSLVATMTGITEVNPLAPHYYCQACHYSEFFTEGEYGSGYDLPDKSCPHCHKPLKKEGQDIPFETFLGFNGDKVPDIDLNFSGDYQSRAHAYTKDLFGVDYVYRAGTIGTVAAKTALGYVRGYLEHNETHLPQAEKERLAYGIEGVKRTTGQHPGGIIVIPDYMDVFDFTPIQFPADDQTAQWRTTHFDFHSIDNNVLKLDILGHDDPTMIRMLQDMSGINPVDIPPIDEKVMQLFQGTEVLGVTPEQIMSDTGTFGIPEFGTNFVRGMVSETKPKTFAELLKISGLSHGTDVWLGNAQELIRKNVVPFSDVIGCRDDIMVSLIQYGLPEKLSFDIMERVRKGRGIPDEWQKEMHETGVPEWYIESCLKIKYMFPKAHAAAYVLMALRVAYFKVHYPLYYYAAYFSVRAKDFDILAMYQGKEMVKKRIRDIQDKGFSATNKETTLVTELEIANEMLERGYRFTMIDLNKSDARNFVIEGDSLIPPFRAIQGLGSSVADQIVAARQEAPFISKEDLQKRGKVSKTIIDFLDAHGVLHGLPDEDQLNLFDV